MRQEQAPKRGNEEPQSGSFDFEKAQFEQERAMVAKKYNVLNEETLTKRGDVWYKDDMPVQDWDSLFSEDDSQPRYH